MDCETREIISALAWPVGLPLGWMLGWLFSLAEDRVKEWKRRKIVSHAQRRTIAKVAR